MKNASLKHRKPIPKVMSIVQTDDVEIGKLTKRSKQNHVKIEISKFNYLYQ